MDHNTMESIFCLLQQFLDKITLSYCGTLDINQPIDGLDPISATAALTLKTMVSAITVTVTHDYTVGFIGTQDGHIIKVSYGQEFLLKFLFQLPTARPKFLFGYIFLQNTLAMHVLRSQYQIQKNSLFPHLHKNIYFFYLRGIAINS